MCFTERCCVCGSTENVRRCGKCKSTSYCSKTCQEVHFPHHSVYCSMIVDVQKVETEKLYQGYSVRQKLVDYKLQRKIVKLVGQKPMLDCCLEGKEFKALWDTGSMISLVNQEWVKNHFPDEIIHAVSAFLEEEDLKIRAANSTEVQYEGVILLEFSVKGGDESILLPFLVAKEGVTDIILGYNVIETLILEGSAVQKKALEEAFAKGGKCFTIEALAAMVKQKASRPDFLTEVKSSRSVTVPAGHKVQLKCRVKAQSNSDEQTVYFSPVLSENEEDVTFTETVSKLRRGRTNYVTVDVLNCSSREYVLQKGTVIGSMHSVASVMPMTQLFNTSDKHGGRKRVDGEESGVDEAVETRNVDSGAGGSGVSCSVDHVDAKVKGVDVEVGEEGWDDDGPGQTFVEGKSLRWDLSHLEDDKRVRMEEMLTRLDDMFSKDDADIGNITDFQMPIHVVDQVPVNASYQKIPPHLYREVKNYIEDLRTNGWIRESYSAYSSPIVCVRKKNGEMRMCVDYRKLNAKTIPDSQPIPRINDILDSLGGAQWFTTLDMSKAYHQGYIEEGSRHLTAFVTPWTIYEWIRIPFGLRNAPPAFQRYMNQILGDLKGFICEPYLDDILCFSKTFEQHLLDVENVLVRLHARGIKLRGAKCVFAKQEVRYLGRLVSGEGYRPDPEDTVALEKFRTPPRTVGELRSLLGFLGYYRCYVRDFSRKVKPLYELLNMKDTKKVKEVGKGKAGQKYDSREKIAFEEQHTKILNELIDYLQSPEVIAFPDFNAPFFINCDASGSGLGAVLYQNQGGKDRVISYASRTLTEAERNYHFHSGKLEFLALKWAITERFADYLRYGPPFQVFTDNNPLTYVLTSAKLNAVGMRWVNDLADYNFTIRYKPGRENVDADYLSRRPAEIEELKRECTEEVEPQTMNAVMSGMRDVGPVVCGGVSASKLILKPDSQIVTVSVEELKEKQVIDEVIAPVHRAVLAGCRPSRKEWADLSHASKILMRSFGKLTVKDGVLLRKTSKYMQIVLPSDFHPLVFKELHEKMGHLGVEKVVDLALQRFYWPKMAADIKQHIRTKCRCVAAKKPNVKERAPLNPIEAQYPFQMISVDFTELERCKGNYRYGMVVIDHFTRFSQFYATRNKSARAAADKLFNEFILQFGLPERIHHDQGREFNNKLFTELHRFTGIKSSNTTPYHPMGDGQVERQNRTLGNMLKALSKNEKKDWRRHLAKLAFACNSTVNKSTGFSPHFLMFGREAKLPIDLVFQEIGIQTAEGQSHEKFAKEWEDSMKMAYQIARNNIRKSAGYNKKHYDQKARTVEIKLGDLVLVRNLRERGGRGTGKLRNYWEEKIFKVIEVKENVPVYTIKNVKKGKDVRTIHRNHLMKVELPLDIFDEKEEPGKEKRKERAKKQERCGVKPTEDIEVPKEESEDSDVELVFEMVSVNQKGESSSGEQNVTREEGNDLNQETVASSDNERQVQEDLEMGVESENVEQQDAVNEEEIVAQGSSDEEESMSDDISSEREQSESVGEDDQSTDDSSSDDEVPRRRVSTRTRIPKKMLTYEKLGGNPTLVEQ